MRIKFIPLLVLFGSTLLARASLTLSSWDPIFKGIDHAVGTNCPPTTVTNNNVIFTDSALQVMHCVRIDLADPDVQLFTTPRAPDWVSEQRETLSLSISNFIRNYGVQVASDANFYSPSDSPAEGVPCQVDGLLVCTGQVVSAADNNGRYASLMFTTNKEPIFNLDNRPPGTDTTGIYTAVTGYYPLLTNGVNVWAVYYDDFFSQTPDFGVHSYQPRTAIGISQDKRYLFILTIDGRQPGSGGGSCGTGYSHGAVDADTAMWLLLCGAWDAISMDGGGSTALYMAGCGGNPIALNHSSLLAGRNAERLIGVHFGAYAQPLPGALSNIVISPADTSATITWQTPTPTTTQVDYGLTAAYGSSSSNALLLRNHVVTLRGLSPSTTYFFRLSGTNDTDVFTYLCATTTTSIPDVTNRTLLFDVTKAWKFTSDDLDGFLWKEPDYDDGSWAGPGSGLLYCENNTMVNPKNTPLPSYDNTNGFPVTGTIPPTYYFRTHFTLTGDVSGLTFYFTNYIDDGAVFYLNGKEIRRVRMAPAPTYTSVTDPPGSGPCGGNEAVCADIFSVSPTNVISGDNVLAVELHQASTSTSDAVFGSAVAYSRPVVPRPTLNFVREDSTLAMYWNGSGFTLIQADSPNGPWTPVPGSATTSPYYLTLPQIPAVKFFQLQK